MRKNTLAPGQLLRSVHIEKSYLGKAGNPPLKVAPGQRKPHVNSYRRKTMHRGKVDPGVSELPGSNESSRDHVNRPIVYKVDRNPQIDSRDWSMNSNILNMRGVNIVRLNSFRS